MATTNIYESRQREYRAGTISMTALGVVFVILRFLVRWKKGLRIGADDYYSSSQHVHLIWRLLMSFACVYCTTVGIVKISILLIYARIFPTRGFRIAAIILGSIVVGWVIAIICVSEISVYLNHKGLEPYPAGYLHQPQGLVYRERSPEYPHRYRHSGSASACRVGVACNRDASAISDSGVSVGLVIFTSAYRFSTLFEFEHADTPWTLATAYTWCLIECSSSINSACMPTLRPLFVMLSSKFSSSIGTRPGTTGAQGSGLKSYDMSSSTLRPAGEVNGKQRVQLETSQPDDASGDEVPLNTIRVQRDVTWQETS
ncbi:uncharacterized protein N7473_003269 [Penicillium subrubescens]|uniref:uncharacterized protein n=1 Tax=Penicillium subrubescens TaxID=1316194 RepID=UPI002545BC5D|nr:uncharacterized protein N7473_003269 [Penicillium subrubescens]KAJ5906353.1 hypothetical protein N7473_003269 [Penicillium subrubescens]